MDLRTIDDASLIARLKELVEAERENTADVVEHLAELDRRDLALVLAFPSLYTYCVEELGYTEQAAYFRIRAASVVRRFPRARQLQRQGELSLETLVRLHSHLDGPQAEDLIEAARGKSRREVEELTSSLCPRPKPPDLVRMVAVEPKKTEPPEEREPLLHWQPVHSSAPAAASSAPPAAELSPPEPPQRAVRFAFTADEQLLALVRRAQELMRHKYPHGRLEDIFRDALGALLDKKDRDRWLEMPKRRRDAKSRAPRAPLRSS